MRFKLRTFSPAHGVQVMHWEATSECDVRARAVREGLEVIDLKSTGDHSLVFGKGHVPVRQFGQELVALAEAGFGVVEALETLQAKEPGAVYRDVLGGVLSRLRAGQSFSQALGAFPEQFPPLFIESVRASEQTGDIARTLRRYVEYEEQLDTLRNHVIAASVYPMLLIVTSFLVIVFMLVYVVPRLAGAYENVRGEVPALSRLLFAWADVASKHGLEVTVGSAVLVALVARVLFDDSTRTRLLRWAEAIPIVGEQIRTYHLARLYRTVGMLLDGGTPLVRALDMARGILPSDKRLALDRARDHIAQGQPLASAFEDAKLTTVVASRMFRVGERSGELAAIMERIAAFHDDRLAQWIKRFIKVFEPALMALIGAFIGGIVLLMYMPIFELAGGLS